MTKIEKHYSPREECLNVWSHAAGAFFALLGLILLLVLSVRTVEYVSAVIYTVSLGILFSGSALYHGTLEPERRAKLRLLDHSAIYFLIAGTYTPLMLCMDPGWAELTVLAVVWGLGIIGVTLELLRIKPFKGFTILLYILMGWACVAVMPQLLDRMSRPAFIFLLSGGIAYTAGVPFYIQRKEFSHALWHIFVIAGAVLQFLSVCLIFRNH